MTPAWTAASALAWPVPRVSWKCTPTATPGQAAADGVEQLDDPQRGGRPDRVAEAELVGAGGDRGPGDVDGAGDRGCGPSNGQSQAVAMMTSSEPPAPCASAAISPTAPTASAVDRPALARLCPSAAETTYSRSATPASTARRRRAGWRPGPTSARRPSGTARAATWSASASAGTALRRDERRRLDPAHAGGDQRLEHLQLGRRAGPAPRAAGRRACRPRGRRPPPAAPGRTRSRWPSSGSGVATGLRASSLRGLHRLRGPPRSGDPERFRCTVVS